MENVIKFPGLGIELKISSVAFELFGMPVAWYGVIIVFAIGLALILCKKNDGLFGISWDDISDLAIYVLPISIVCARLYYVVFEFDNFKGNLIDIINIRQGGLAIYGALIGGAITIILFCYRRKINVYDLLDYVVPYVVLGQAIGRWGNFFNIEAYGSLTTLPWRMGIHEGIDYIEVHPTFLYESICNFIIFFILLIIRKKRSFKGEVLYLYIILYSFFRMFIEGLRIDSLMLFNIRISQFLSMMLFVVFSIILLKNVAKNIKVKKNKEK